MKTAQIQLTPRERRYREHENYLDGLPEEKRQEWLELQRAYFNRKKDLIRNIDKIDLLKINEGESIIKILAQKHGLDKDQEVEKILADMFLINLKNKQRFDGYGFQKPTIWFENILLANSSQKEELEKLDSVFYCSVYEALLDELNEVKDLINLTKSKITTAK